MTGFSRSFLLKYLLQSVMSSLKAGSSKTREETVKKKRKSCIVSTEIDNASSRTKKARMHENQKKSVRSTGKKASSNQKSKSKKSTANMDTPNANIVQRDKQGKLIFPEFADFKPNMTPKEVLQSGSFGGTYFRPIFSSVTGTKLFTN